MGFFIFLLQLEQRLLLLSWPSRNYRSRLIITLDKDDESLTFFRRNCGRGPYLFLRIWMGQWMGG